MPKNKSAGSLISDLKRKQEESILLKKKSELLLIECVEK